MERIRVADAARMILQQTEIDVPLKSLPEMPTGPYNRIASNRLAKELLDWEPKVMFREGIQHTIDWYVKNRNPEEIRSKLEFMLTER